MRNPVWEMKYALSGVVSMIACPVIAIRLHGHLGHQY